MRIAIFSDFSLDQLSGISDSIGSLMQGLSKKGHTLRLYTSDYPRSAVKGERADICALPSIGLPRSPDHRLVVPIGGMNDVRRFRPDMIHVQTTGVVGLWALRAARKLDVPLVGTDHTFPADYLYHLHMNIPIACHAIRSCAAWFYRHCIMVTAPSKAMLQELKDYGMRNPSIVISNPIETHLFRPLPDRMQIRVRLGLSGPVILSFGRIAKEKNVSESMEIFAAVLRKECSATLLVIGDGPERPRLEEQAHRLCIAGHVRFLGVLKEAELVEAINAADIYLITSRSETQSMCTLQAMACGLPTVGVDQGALPEYIQHGENGYIGKAGDIEQMADLLLSIIRDDAKRSAFARTSRTIAERFSPETITEEFEKVYQKAMQSA